VLLLYFKCCHPKAAHRELARVVASLAEVSLHHETVKALLERYFFWRHPEFQKQVQYPVPAEPQARRLEMVRLQQQGWSEKGIAAVLHCAPVTVNKWLRRYKQEQARTPQSDAQPWLLDHSHAPLQPRRKVYIGAIHAVLILQKKYGYAGWFRVKGYLEKDYGIHLGQTTIKKIMALNRRLHLAPQRPVKVSEARDTREGPPKSQHPFQHTYIDLRYLDAKPEGVQLYSCLLLEGFSRTILAGSLTREQDVGVILHLYYQALVYWGFWEELISDHGGQFQSHEFRRVNQRLGITHTMYEKGHPWQNLIESQFGIQARLGEYGWQRCATIAAAQEFHRDLIRDHNRLPHYAHRFRNDQKRAPLEVLGAVKGREVGAADLHQAFSRKFWQRETDARGFVRLGRWRIYVEEALPRTPVQVRYWDGKLSAEYDSHVLTEYECKWDRTKLTPKAISQMTSHQHPFQSRQQPLFDPLWLRDPVERVETTSIARRKQPAHNEQLRLYFGPELVRTA